MNPCADCGALLVATDWGELCGACALSGGLAHERELIGDYERCQLLGEGAMGRVYLARHIHSDEVVALKLAKAELLALPGGHALFRQQAKLESALKHPSIVNVRADGAHEGTPYLVMPLMEGGTLAETNNAQRFTEPKARLELVLEIAKAVQFAHERGVLHCDLKPENILFDAARKPHVSDFGLARSIGATPAAVSIEGGTRGWMSPEQARGDALTTASDVFALGVLLHWLGSGELPFGGGEDFERRVQSDPPPKLRPWSPELAWGLDAVAARCLAKAPAERYESAAALVEDLERLRTERCVRGQVVPFWGRTWHRAERHPGARNAIFLLLPCFAAITLFMAASQRAELRRAVLDVNAYAASGQAAAVLYQLREYADAVGRAASDPAVRALTHGPLKQPPPPAVAGANLDPCRTQQSLEVPTALQPYAGRFATLTVLDENGCARARISEEVAQQDYVQRSFTWRDYFASAARDADRPERITYVRPAYRSSVSQQIKFAVSSPLFEGERWIGVVAGSMVAAATLDLPRMKRSDNTERLTVLVGPIEGERDGPHTPPASRDFTLVAHPKLQRGGKVVLGRDLTRELVAALGRPGQDQRQFELGTALPLQRANYVDPILGGRWLAAFAPVGATGYVVLVQTRDDLAIRPSNGLWRTGLGLAFGSALLLAVWSTFFVWRHRREGYVGTGISDQLTLS
jgi:eukaryotic-like serine/threonine-protein kinase